jgi:hypothetical protein
VSLAFLGRWRNYIGQLYFGLASLSVEKVHEHLFRFELSCSNQYGINTVLCGTGQVGVQFAEESQWSARTNVASLLDVAPRYVTCHIARGSITVVQWNCSVELISVYAF